MPEINKFSTLAEAWALSKRAMFSDFTPPKISAALEGSFYAGAQCMFTMMAEALEITPEICHEDIGKLFAEMNTFFLMARAKQEGKIEEKRRER